MTLTKRDLVNRISDKSPLSRLQVTDIVQRTLDSISEALAKGNRAELRDFGVFEVKVRKSRVGRNPRKPETDMPIPARCMVKFKVGKELRTKVLMLSAEPRPVPAQRPRPTSFPRPRFSPPAPAPISGPPTRPQAR